MDQEGTTRRARAEPPHAPPWVWRLMFGVAVASLGLAAWGAVTIVAEPHVLVAGDLREDEALADDISWEEAWAEPPADPYDDDRFGDDPYAYDDEPFVQEPVTDSPVNDSEPADGRTLDAPVTAITTEGESQIPAVDPGERLAQARALLRRRAESQAASEHAAAEYGVGLEDEDITSDDESWEEPPGEPLDPLPNVSFPWDVQLRFHLSRVLWLLLAGLLVFVGRRNGEPRLGFAGLILGVYFANNWLLVLLPHLPTVDDFHATLLGLQMHFPALSFALIALTARRRAGILVALIVVAEACTSLYFEWQLRHGAGDAGVLFMHATEAVGPVVVAGLFMQRGWGKPADEGTAAGGPYRSAAGTVTDTKRRPVVQNALRIFGAWFALQLLLSIQLPLHIVERLSCANYVLAADVLAATLITLEAWKTRTPAERSAWGSVAVMLWTLAGLNAVGSTLLMASWDAVRAEIELVTAIRSLLAVCAGVSLGLLAAGLRVSAAAASDQSDVAPGSKSGRIALVIVGIIGLRWLVVPAANDEFEVWLPLVITGSVGIIAFRSLAALTLAETAARDPSSAG